MTLEKTISAVLILACLSFGAITWEEYRADRASLDKTIAIQQQIIDAAESREQSRDANLRTTLSQIASVNRVVQTPQQIVSALQKFLSLPKPITLNTNPVIDERNPRQGSQLSQIGEVSKKTEAVTVPELKLASDLAQPLSSSRPNATPGNCCPLPTEGPHKSLPATADLKSEILDFFARQSNPHVISTAPQLGDPTPTAGVIGSNPGAIAAIPAADLEPLFDKVQSCRSCEARLTVSQADLEDEKARSAALTKERDAALISAKGTSFWHRLKQNVKWLAIGAAVTAGASRIRWR